MHRIAASMHGMYRDVLENSKGEVLHDSGWRANTIVDGCRLLLAGFMKNDASQGLQKLYVGEGKEEWDTQWDDNPAPAPAPVTTEGLENPYSTGVVLKKADIDYLDGSDKPVLSPTNRIQIKVKLEPGYPAPLAPLMTYPLREFGLFGVFDGKEFMVNCIRHPVIHKDASSTLYRIVRLYF
jgi:hypothetical protein